jgi:LysR family glycine cleavage system transcriptional activator
MHEAALPSTQSLLAFESAARLLSFQAAGAELGLTPSAISHRIKNLETYCGQSLFYRETRSVALTPAGEAQRILVLRILRLLRELSSHPTSEEQLRVYTPPLFFVGIILPGLEAFQQKHGNVELHVVQTRHQLDQFDVAVHYGRLTKDDWTTLPLISAHHIAVCAPWIAEAGTDLSGVLKRHPFIDFSYARSAWRGVVDDEVRLNRRARKIMVSSMTEAVAAAKAGLGVALVIEELIQDELRMGTLTALSEPRQRRHSFYLSYRSGIHSSRLLRSFRAWLTHRCDAISRVAISPS